MCVHVREHRQVFRLAEIPELAECSAVNVYVASETAGVEGVEVLNVLDSTITAAAPQEEGAGLTPAFASSAQLFDQRAPLPPAQLDERPRD